MTTLQEESQQDLSFDDSKGPLNANGGNVDLDKSDSDFSDHENDIFKDDLPGGLVTKRMWRAHYSVYLHSSTVGLTESLVKFAIIYCISASFKNSLLLVAAYATLNGLFKLFLTPMVHNNIGKFTRLRSTYVTTSLKVFFSIAVLVIVLLLSKLFYDPINLPWDNSGFIVSWIFFVLFGILSEVSELAHHFVMLDLATIISNSTHHSSSPAPTELATIKSRLVFLSKTIGPFIFAIILSVFMYSMTIAIAVLIALVVLFAVLEFLLINNISKNYPEISSGNYLPTGVSGERVDENRGWFDFTPFLEFKSQSSFLACLGLIFVCFSTLSAQIPILANYLVSEGASVFELAAFQGLSTGAFGLGGGLVTPQLVAKIGLSKTAVLSVGFIVLFTIIAFIQVAAPSISVWLLIIPMILSRPFNWILEVSEKQILKESTSDEQSFLQSNGIQYQLCTLFSLLSYSIAIFCFVPSNYIYLASFSLASVFLGAGSIALWYKWHGHAHEHTTILS